MPPQYKDPTSRTSPHYRSSCFWPRLTSCLVFGGNGFLITISRALVGGLLFLNIFFRHLMNRLLFASTQFSFSLAVARNFMVPFFGYVSSLGGTAFQSPFLVLGGLLFLYIFFRHLMNRLSCASTQFSFSHRTDSHTIPYPSQGVPLMAGFGFLANNGSEQVLVCVRIDISTLLLIFTHQHTFVTFDNVEKYWQQDRPPLSYTKYKLFLLADSEGEDDGIE